MAKPIFVASPTRPAELRPTIDKSSTSIREIQSTPSAELQQVKIAAGTTVSSDAELASAKSTILQESIKPTPTLSPTETPEVVEGGNEVADEVTKLTSKIEIENATSDSCPEWGCELPDFNLGLKLKGLQFGLKIPDWLKWSFDFKDSGVLGRILGCTAYLANEGVAGYHKISGKIAELNAPEMYKELSDIAGDYKQGNWKAALSKLPNMKDDLRKVINLAGGDPDLVDDAFDLLDKGEFTGGDLVNPANAFDIPGLSTQQDTKLLSLITKDPNIAQRSLQVPGVKATYSLDKVKNLAIANIMGFDPDVLAMGTAASGMVDYELVADALLPVSANVSETQGITTKYYSLTTSEVQRDEVGESIVLSQSPGNTIVASSASMSELGLTTNVSDQGTLDISSAVKGVSVGNNSRARDLRQQEIAINQLLVRGNRSAVSDIRLPTRSASRISVEPTFETDLNSELDVWYGKQYSTIMVFA